MNFDATTFALEVLNFLVLVWVLKHWLYRPVLDVIERRRAEDEHTLAAARAQRDEAAALKAQYEQQLAGAGEDRERERAALAGEMAAERTRQLAAVEAEAQAELERRRTLAARDDEQRGAQLQREAQVLAARFAARLLERLAGPALEDGLAGIALADLALLPPATREALREALAGADAGVEIASAYPLAAPRRDAWAQALSALAGRSVTLRPVEDPTLKAGVRVQAGAWVLMANLRDELAFFGTALDHGP